MTVMTVRPSIWSSRMRVPPTVRARLEVIHARQALHVRADVAKLRQAERLQGEGLDDPANLQAARDH
jgi:hypothetical protein